MMTMRKEEEGEQMKRKRRIGQRKGSELEERIRGRKNEEKEEEGERGKEEDDEDKE